MFRLGDDEEALPSSSRVESLRILTWEDGGTDNEDKGNDTTSECWRPTTSQVPGLGPEEIDDGEDTRVNQSTDIYGRHSTVGKTRLGVCEVGRRTNCRTYK